MNNAKLSRAMEEEQRFNLQPHVCLMGYVGSTAHGTYIPKDDDAGIDDKDVMGIAIPPTEYFHGLKKFEQSEIFFNEWDVVVYEIRKMFRLLIKSNPNVISLLWLPKVCYLHVDEVGREILENRHLFVSKAMYHSFAGYANSQLAKMERHEHKGYMGAKRKALVDKFGYDTKNAAHLIRLLTMAIETLTEGELYVNRGDRDASKLIAIKKGEWPIERVKSEADTLFKQAREAYMRSPLKDKPDSDAIDHLLTKLVSRVIRKRLERERL